MKYPNECACGRPTNGGMLCDDCAGMTGRCSICGVPMVYTVDAEKVCLNRKCREKTTRKEK